MLCAGGGAGCPKACCLLGLKTGSSVAAPALQASGRHCTTLVRDAHFTRCVEGKCERRFKQEGLAEEMVEFLGEAMQCELVTHLKQAALYRAAHRTVKRYELQSQFPEVREMLRVHAFLSVCILPSLCFVCSCLYCQ